MKTFYYNGLNRGNHMLGWYEYNWNCPKCGVPMQAYELPENELCDICQQLLECKCCGGKEPFEKLTADGYVCKECGAILIITDFENEYYLNGVKL